MHKSISRRRRRRRRRRRCRRRRRRRRRRLRRPRLSASPMFRVLHHRCSPGQRTTSASGA